MAIELAENDKKVASPACENTSGTPTPMDENAEVVTPPLCENTSGSRLLTDENVKAVTPPLCKNASGSRHPTDENVKAVTPPACKNASGSRHPTDENAEVVTPPIHENASSAQLLTDENVKAVTSHLQASCVREKDLGQADAGALLEWETVTPQESATQQSTRMTPSCETPTRTSGTRYRLLDVARGVTLLNMIAYHLLYDLVHIFGVEMPWYTSTIGYVWQQLICWTFIFISGISCNLSHGNAARGARLLLFGAAMTLVTWLTMPEQLVVFGVLSFLGCAGIIYALLEKPLKKIPAWLGLTVSVALFLFSKGAPAGFVGVGDLPLIPLPAEWYSVYAMFPVGFPTSDFYSSDYFSIIPWIFLYFAGFFFWRALRSRSLFELRGVIKLPMLELMGRNTLPIYLAHQPLIYGALWLVFQIMQH